MEDQNREAEVVNHDSLQHQIELQLEAHPEVNDEEDLLLLEYHETKRLEGALNDEPSPPSISET